MDGHLRHRGYGLPDAGELYEIEEGAGAKSEGARYDEADSCRSTIL